MPRKTDSVTLADGRVVPVRQLGWLQLRASQRAYQQASARNLIEMGGAEFMAAWRAMQAPATEVDESAKPAAPVDVLDGHDLLTVLSSGIQSWTREQIEDLEEADAERLGRAILALSPTPRTETDLGNAPAPSTAA